MVLEIVKYGNPVLGAKGAEITQVDEKVRKLAEDMLETMRAANGVGLAAQQVGVPVQLTVIDVSDVEDRPSEMFIDGKKVKIEDHMPMVLLNPVLEYGADKEEGVEGCLSFPELSADIMRSWRSFTVIGSSSKVVNGIFTATMALAITKNHQRCPSSRSIR